MSTATCEPVIGPEYKSEEWYALRQFNPDRKERPIVFGASDSATICNQSPYSTPFEFYHQARGEMEREARDEETETRIRLGLRLESPILDEYEFQQGVKVERNIPMLLSSQHSFMGASLDGRVRTPGEEREVDAKNSGFRMFDSSGEDVNKFGRSGTDQVPSYILFQAQHQLAVTGTGRADFAVLVDGSTFKIYSVQRNEDLIAQIVAAEQEMAERIIAGDPPEPNWSHSGTNRVLKSMYGVEVGQVVELTPDLHEAFLEWQRLRLVKKDAEDAITEIQNRLLHAMGEAEVARFPGSNVQVKRTVTKTSYYTADDVRKAEEKLGQVKRSGSMSLRTSKVKK